jgi:hypothetical protein
MEGGGITLGPGGGDNKPKFDKKTGGQLQHAKEGANLEPRESGGQAGASPTKAERVGDTLSKVSETAKDVKDVAKAGPTGLESTGKEIKEGAEKARAEGKSATKGAAAAAGREAAGQAVATGLDAVTLGLTAEAHGKIAKGVSKALKKENLKKIIFAFVAFISVPLVIIGIFVGVLIYASQNPAKFLEQVIVSPKSREFAVQAAKLVGKKFVADADFYKRYGYVEKGTGKAIAAPVTNPVPIPGSIEDKILKINISNARYQTNSAPSCPYTYTTKEMVGPNGKTTSVIDQVKNQRGEIVDRDTFLVDYCIAESMPLYNMMARTQKTRDVNAFSNTILNYADSDDSPNLQGKSNEELKKYVYDKTYNRITSKSEQDPITNLSDVNLYIKKVREALATGANPDNINFEFKGDPNDIGNITKTLCTFSQGYLTKDNIKKGIYSRLNSGQRSGVKWNTIASTRELGKMKNEELNPTYLAIDGWQDSRAYFQNLYGTQFGQPIDPERLGNTSYGAGYVDTLSLLYALKDRCDNADDTSLSSFIGSLFGGGGNVEQDKIRALYVALKEIIVAQSNGKFTSPKDFGVEQLMQGVIRMGGGSAVSGLESGPQNFNNQSQGFRALSNQYMMRMGGRFLTRAEYSSLNALAENTTREIESKNGIAYRLFGRDNLRSIANVMMFEAPITPNGFSRKSKQLIASLSNPIKIMADIHSNFSYVALGKINLAFAADKTGDAYMRLNSIGLTEEDFGTTDLINNSNEIQNLIANGSPAQKEVLADFDKCSKSNIPSQNLFSRLYTVRFSEDDEEATVLSKEAGVIKGKEDLPYYAAINDDPTLLGFVNKKQMVACEIYLMPKSHEVYRDYLKDGAKYSQNKLFGFNITDLARKYRLYLYANGMVDLMVELSNTEYAPGIYANPSEGVTR